MAKTKEQIREELEKMAEADLGKDIERTKYVNEKSTVMTDEELKSLEKADEKKADSFWKNWADRERRGLRGGLMDPPQSDVDALEAIDKKEG